MATREERIKTLKKIRTSIKKQIITQQKQINTFIKISTEEAELRISNLVTLQTKFNDNQDEIDALISEDSVEQEVLIRHEIQETIIILKLKLGELQKNDTQVTPVSAPSTSSAQTTFKVNFAPYQENETFQNFTKRLEVYMELQNQPEDENKKKYVLLNAITPHIHQTLYDLCSPENPLTKSYKDLIDILQNFLDPKPSIWARQHKFIQRTQQEDETVMEFDKELRKLAGDCEFFCSCRKSIADSFLRLQFIRGLSDDDIRIKILQEKSKITYKEIVEFATNISMSKAEAVIHKKEPILQIKRQTNNTRTPKSQNNTSFKLPYHQCYRCGDTRHRANECRHKNTVCDFCGKSGHLSKICLQRINSKNQTNLIDEQNDLSPSEEQITEINQLYST